MIFSKEFEVNENIDALAKVSNGFTYSVE